MISLFESLTGLLLLDPWMLMLALLLLIALLVQRFRGAPAFRFTSGIFLTGEPQVANENQDQSNYSTKKVLPSRSLRVRLLPLPRILQVIGLLLVILALARPVHRTQVPFETEGIDILLCIDISSSMTAKDMDLKRTRLEVAKDSAVDFIAGRPDDRIGLICFARYPDLNCPLTLDHDALKILLSGLTTVKSDSPEDATGIGAAIARAAQVLSSSSAKSKVVILLTDGVENVATAQTQDEIAPLHASQLCEKLSVRVYAIAAGTDNKGLSGGRVKYDTAQVKRMTVKTGGKYYETRDAGAVTSVYTDINNLEKVELDEPHYRIEEKFTPFLIAALALLLISRLLLSTVLEVLP